VPVTITKLDIQHVLDQIGILRLEAEALAGLVDSWGELPTNVPGVNDVVTITLKLVASELASAQAFLREVLEED
jgi:hypothetical protein